MSFQGLTEWMQGWRSSDCWRQTVPCPGGSDKKCAISQWRPSSCWYDEHWWTQWSQTLSGLHSSDLLKLVGRRTGRMVPDYVDTWIQGQILYWILSWIRSQSFNSAVMWSAYLTFQLHSSDLLKLVGRRTGRMVRIGARLCWHLNTRTNSLYWILSWIRSQSFNTAVIWSAYLTWQSRYAYLGL